MKALKPPNQGFTDLIEWPNGEGYTPCSAEYAAKMDEADAIFDPNVDSGSSDDLPPADYEKYHRLRDALLQMQASGGHIGKPVRY